MSTEDTNTAPTPDELRAQIATEVRDELTAAFAAERAKERAELDELLRGELDAAPPHLQRLIPEALPLADQVKWLRKAKESGASFASAVPQTDSRRPNNNAQDKDASSLNPIQRIAAGYATR